MIVNTIESALTPAFVLVACGNIMAILTTRLGRVVDRSRDLQERYGTLPEREHDLLVLEIRSIDRRIELLTRSIRLLVLSSVLIGITVTLLFFEEVGVRDYQPFAAFAFFAAIIVLIWALLVFMRESGIASATLRVSREYLELERTIQKT